MPTNAEYFVVSFMFLTFLTNNYLKAIAVGKVDITKFPNTACALNVRNFYLWEVGGGGEGVGGGCISFNANKGTELAALPAADIYTCNTRTEGLQVFTITLRLQKAKQSVKLKTKHAPGQSRSSHSSPWKPSSHTQVALSHVPWAEHSV